jgi:hypothetical protein
MWAFGYRAEEATHIWKSIPLDADIVVTHTPAKYHCDERKDRRAVGCEALRQALWRIRPRLAICGHVHEGRGVERIHWDLGASNIKYKESSVAYWEDTGKDNKKMSRIDLTQKGRHPLENDGSVGGWNGEDINPLDCLSRPGSSTTEARTNSRPSSRPSSQSPSRPSSQPAVQLGAADATAAPPELLPQSCWGQGGSPPSKRCDLEALWGRMGRKETCVINAAMMASSWPHAAGGGKRFNKPIVVDIDLPLIEQ